MNLAVKDIRANLLKFLLTALGVGMLLMAAQDMAGLYRGIVADAMEIIDDSKADLWVVQARSEGPFADASKLDRSLAERVRGVPGVAKARQFAMGQKRFQVGGKVVRGSLVGLDFPHDRGEWTPLVAGRVLDAGSGEAIADAGTGLWLGQAITIGHQTCTVVGVARGLVDSSGNPVVAASVNDVLAMEDYLPSETVRLEQAAGLPSRNAAQQKIDAIMVNLAPGANPAAVRATLLQWGDVTVLSRKEERDVLLLGRLDKLRMQILMFLVVLLIVSAVVISVTIYSMTVEKIHEIALLKLIGARNSVIVRMIMEQSLLLGGVAFCFSLAAGHYLTPLFPRRLVQPAGDRVGFASAELAICLVGSGMGIWKALLVEAREILS